MGAPQSSTTTGSMSNGPLYWSSAALCQGREWVPGTSGGWRWVLVSSLRTRIETTKSPVEASRVTTTKKIQGHPHKCRKGYANVLLWPRWPASDRLPASLLANIDHPSPSDQIEATRQAHPWGHSAPRQCKASYVQHNHGTLAEIQMVGSRSPSIQSRSLSMRLCHFWSPKKGFEGQSIHLGWRCQAVHAELVHNAAPGILRDSHSLPCVAVGQVSQQPGPVLPTYRYWFLLLRLVSFWMPLILVVFMWSRFNTMWLLFMRNNEK